MRLICMAAIVLGIGVSAQAHHPDRENQPVHPRIDVIGPLGNRLPMSYRRRYNRPTNIGGKIAYHIAPTSMEAMAWHDATHRGLYENHRPRTEMHYFYPKPYEALKMGPRPKPDAAVAKPKSEDIESARENLESEIDKAEADEPDAVKETNILEAGLDE